MAALVSLAVRTLHVLAMAVLVGGSVAVWYGYRNSISTDLTAARQFEWLFWGAIGAIVLTGVGNLGALGPPGPSTDWGRTLLVKLTIVVGLITGSAVRTLLVVRAEEIVQPQKQTGQPRPASADGGSGGILRRSALQQTLSRAYGLTAGTLLLLVILAEVLAHG